MRILVGLKELEKGGGKRERGAGSGKGHADGLTLCLTELSSRGRGGFFFLAQVGLGKKARP